MTEFEFEVVEDFIGCYIGRIKIKAKTLDNAIRRLNKMNKEKVASLVDQWDTGDDTQSMPDSPLWVYKDGEEITQIYE